MTNRLGSLGEGQLDDGLVDRGQTVEQELRVEARWSGPRPSMEASIDSDA
jgi:hypothetical protein